MIGMNVTPHAFNVPDGGVPWDDLRKMLHGIQRVAKVQNGEEILPKVSTPEYGARTLQTTDRRRTDLR